jgi:hypothetical protein
LFAVDDLDDTLARLRRHGAQLADEFELVGDVPLRGVSGAVRLHRAMRSPS